MIEENLQYSLKLLKLTLEIKQTLCISKNNENTFQKFHFVFDNI